jgi:hypothetical protein
MARIALSVCIGPPESVAERHKETAIDIRSVASPHKHHERIMSEQTRKVASVLTKCRAV